MATLRFRPSAKLNRAVGKRRTVVLTTTKKGAAKMKVSPGKAGSGAKG